MGTWGPGPFDSDGALDFLDGLAHRYATMNDDGDIDAASVDAPAVTAELRTALLAVTEPAADGEYRPQTVEDAYAAAGLVATALSPVTPEVSGTRLFGVDTGHDGADRLGLNHHAGHKQLLSPEAATALLPDAVAAATAIGGETDWLDLFIDRHSVVDAVAQLTQTLELHRATATG